MVISCYCCFFGIILFCLFVFLFCFSFIFLFSPLNTGRITRIKLREVRRGYNYPAAPNRINTKHSLLCVEDFSAFISAWIHLHYLWYFSIQYQHFASVIFKNRVGWLVSFLPSSSMTPPLSSYITLFSLSCRWHFLFLFLLMMMITFQSEVQFAFVQEFLLNGADKDRVKNE